MGMGQWVEAISEYNKLPKTQEIIKKIEKARAEIRRSMRKDLYAILGIQNKKAGDNEIKKAYRKAAVQWHPDKHFTAR